MAGEVGIYIIDACCIIGLENAHTGQSQQYIYPAVEQRKIWDGLQALAEAGQLKIVNEVVREISARTQGRGRAAKSTAENEGSKNQSHHGGIPKSGR